MYLRPLVTNAKCNDENLIGVAGIYIFLSYALNHLVTPSDLSWVPFGGLDP